MGIRGRALVTGASSGIGLELARILAREGYDLLLTARRLHRLEELRVSIRAETGDAVDVDLVEADLTRDDAADRIAAHAAGMDGGVSVLVNNAGVGAFGRFDEGDPDSYTRMIAINIGALTRLTRLLLPAMVTRGGGMILNVASVAAFQPGPLMAVYYATKAYVLSLSEALAEELVGTGVSATALCPGPTRTEFHEQAGVPVAQTATARAVAEAGYRGMVRGRRIVITGLLFRLLILFSRFLPRRSSAAFVHFTQKRRLKRRRM